MSDDVPDSDTAIDIARQYADDECVGEPGDIVDVTEQDNEWAVEIETHGYSDTYTHRIRLTKTVGNVIAHERLS